ncbi:MAG TPA: GNAT family N-acetyltransferase [Pyrinomonadaceae bacterium]|jgi:predicted GNAT superfamily acetyltransferase
MPAPTEDTERAGPAQIEMRECATIEEYEACVRLQREVFGGPEIEISPRRHLIASRRAGGWTLGAFDLGEMVGFVHLMAGVRGGQEIIGYSHMMAILPSYQNRGLGARLKWAQRERALREGRSYITWTWDPMQARNAHFNLNRLGATVSSYGVNFYGTDYVAPAEGTTERTGIDSDRLFADWDLNSPRVVERALALSTVEPGAGASAIEIPADWRALLASDAKTARREQLRVREEFKSAFASGLVCAGFDRDPHHPRYLLYESQTLG